LTIVADKESVPSFGGPKKETVLATPYVNSVGYSYVNPSTLGAGRFVASGYEWDDGGSPAVVLTYSFPTGTAYHASNYDEWSSWFSLSSPERAAVRAALNTLSHFANVSFVETSDTSTNVGELRFAYSNTLGNDEAAHAYFPFSHPSAGDVWFNPDHFNTDRSGIPVGSYDYLTILHEVGHSLGLKHSFTAPNAIAAGLDSFFYSIMSYTASPWSAHGDNYASFYPTTPMYYDLLALQALYGVRSYNNGNNIYVFKDGVRYWQAIHDTGGADTIVYQGVESVTIDLIPGHFSTLSEAIGFTRPNGTTQTSKATVTIGPKVVIESAHGGSGNDVLLGNTVANILNGHAGNDSLRGGYGNDRMLGGPGDDNFRFHTLPNSTTNHDTLPDYVPADDRIELENAFFTKVGTAGHTLATAFFRAAAHALDGNDYIVYNRATGNLYYDANGSAAGQEVLFATLTTKPLLTAAEFFIV
jgi:Ca2+-binding RTX toxin-like protein